MGGLAKKKKSHLVNWPAFCIDEREEGLDIRTLSSFNKALLDKWCFRFFIEKESFYKIVIIRKYEEEKV